ncbi:MAG: hypothetical protein AVDCRST_MAG39-2400, partial [uncultured Sphingomonadaceae bacterium]
APRWPRRPRGRLSPPPPRRTATLRPPPARPGAVGGSAPSGL